VAEVSFTSLTSEISDPVLQAFGGALTIEGVQSVGVIATLKHLIANEQEQFRMWNLLQPGLSSNLDDRTMHELYLWPFAEGVRAGVGSVMVAYNAVSELVKHLTIANGNRSMDQPALKIVT
jgi:beta-glucosidase-like glycosyl hydrolase